MINSTVIVTKGNYPISMFDVIALSCFDACRRHHTIYRNSFRSFKRFPANTTLSLSVLPR